MRRTTQAVAVIAGLIGLLSAGCQDMYLSDNIDIDFDFHPLRGASDSLHTPYVLGTEVTIYAHDALDDDEESWRLECLDESVLRVDEHLDGHIRCTAVGVGTAELRVYDESGEVVHTGEVEVRAPNRSQLYAHGPLIIGQEAGDPRVGEGETIRVLEGGMASFLVRYFDGDQRLYGNGVLVAESAGQIELFEETTFLAENREWLQLRPNATGFFNVELYAGDLEVGSVRVEGVTASEVDHVELIGQSERGADTDDPLVILAQAYDEDGDPVYGVEYQWDVGGFEQSDTGDLYRYSFDSSYDVELAARFQGHEDQILIHSNGGYVDSTNDLGCNLAGGRPGLPVVPVALLLLGLAVARQRRRRR